MEKYRFIAEIDKGSYSIVYRAQLRATGEMLAIKRMHKPIALQQKLQLRELKILETVKHPCLVSLR